MSVEPSAPRPRPRRGALERLYVLWLTSTVMLVLCAVITIVMTRGAVASRDARLRSLEERLAQVEQSLDGVVRDEPVATPPAARPATARPAAPTPTATTPPPPPAPAKPLTEEAVAARLDDVLSAEPVTPADVNDENAARNLLTDVAAQPQAPWTAATWARLAVLARLTGDAGADVLCIRQAGAAGDPLTTYHEIVIRELLARARTREALAAAHTLLEQGATPVARVLAATAHVANQEAGPADELLAGLTDLSTLATYDRLLLDRAHVALESWDALPGLLAGLRELPPTLLDERGFLIAVSFTRAGRTVEALAILDGLAGDDTSLDDSLAESAWPPLRPSRYDLELWRGVTLLRASRIDTARETLTAAAELDPSRPEAQYQLGLLESRAGRDEVARMHLKNAVAASDRFAPAWEALAVLDLDADAVPAALQSLERAVSARPRRAAAHFLMAVAYAKLSQESQARDALRAALGLDISYLETAKQTEVLLRLLTPAEMEALAAAPRAARD